MLEKLEVRTESRTAMKDITAAVDGIVSKSGITSGLCCIFVPHTTAAVTVNENADPDVRIDIVRELDRIIPFDDGYLHGEGNSAAHIKASLVGPSVVLMVDGGRLLLGTWQGVFLCEFDGPRLRSVYVKIVLPAG